MPPSESELDMVCRHVAQGERHVALQEKILDHLHEIGGSTEIAEQLLVEFRSTLTAHRSHRDRLLAQVPAS
jgi:hypothetical protein